MSSAKPHQKCLHHCRPGKQVHWVQQAHEYEPLNLITDARHLQWLWSCNQPWNKMVHLNFTSSMIRLASIKKYRKKREFMVWHTCIPFTPLHAQLLWGSITQAHPTHLMTAITPETRVVSEVCDATVSLDAQVGGRTQDGTLQIIHLQLSHNPCQNVV